MRCRRCGSTRDVHSARHKGGGAYNRAPRWYRSSLCHTCATTLAAGGITPGTMTVGQWSVSDVRRITGGTG